MKIICQRGKSTLCADVMRLHACTSHTELSITSHGTSTSAMCPSACHSELVLSLDYSITPILPPHPIYRCKVHVLLYPSTLPSRLCCRRNTGLVATQVPFLPSHKPALPDCRSTMCSLIEECQADDRVSHLLSSIFAPSKPHAALYCHDS